VVRTGLAIVGIPRGWRRLTTRGYPGVRLRTGVRFLRTSTLEASGFIDLATAAPRWCPCWGRRLGVRGSRGGPKAHRCAFRRSATAPASNGGSAARSSAPTCRRPVPPLEAGGPSARSAPSSRRGSRSRCPRATPLARSRPAWPANSWTRTARQLPGSRNPRFR
jgi:hypothetical protein